MPLSGSCPLCPQKGNSFFGDPKLGLRFAVAAVRLQFPQPRSEYLGSVWGIKHILSSAHTASGGEVF